MSPRITKSITTNLRDHENYLCIMFDEMLPLCPSTLPALPSGVSSMHTAVCTSRVQTPDCRSSASPHGRAGHVSEPMSRSRSRSRQQHGPHLSQLSNPDILTAMMHYAAIVKAAIVTYFQQQI